MHSTEPDNVTAKIQDITEIINWKDGRNYWKK